VGQAKLELVKVRLALDFAKAQYDRTVQSTANALAMVEAMLSGVGINQIEERFRDRSIGELRSQLMSAYARKFQAKAQYDIDLQSRGTISEAAIIKSRSDNDTAEAVYRALCEETKFQGQIQVRSLEQKLREAQTAQSLARAQLLMYGYTTAEVDAMDPIAEGAAVSLYPVRAPFSGTITEQHAVIAERIGPLVQMFQISDYSRLWMTADIYENDLPLVRGITGKKLRFRSSAGMAISDAEVFSVSGEVDATTRTVSMRALVSNSAGDYKSGSFVDVELVQSGPVSISVPLESIQREGRQAFVFVLDGEDKFRRMDVQLGAESEGEQVVESGLSPGMKIAVRGGFILKSELMKDLMAGE
jgi:cobalt-zinc-cadmium efflux system membrane fusion protein